MSKPRKRPTPKPTKGAAAGNTEERLEAKSAKSPPPDAGRPPERDPIGVPAERVTDIRAALDSEYELLGADLHRLRVDLSAARGRSAMRAIERSLRTAPRDAYPLTFFTGHIGSGKTTELRWLAERLSSPGGERRFYVIYADALDYFFPFDVRLPEFLVAMFHALAVDPVLGEVVTRSAAGQGFWDLVYAQVKNHVEGLSPNVAFGPQLLVTNLRTVVGLQRRLSEALHLRLPELLDLLNQVVRAARVAVRDLAEAAGRYDDLVILFDGLDRVQPQVLPDGKTSHDIFYLDQLPSLRGLSAHLVLTVPLEFLGRTHRMTNVFQNPVRVLPMVPVHHIGDPDLPHKEGIACLTEVLARRVKLDAVFKGREALEHAIVLSGGSLRQLFRIVVDAVTEADELPLGLVDIDRGVQHQVLSFERAIQGRAWLPALHVVHRSRDFPMGFDEATKQELLEGHIVFEYNGTLWYDVNPIVQRTASYRNATP